MASQHLPAPSDPTSPMLAGLDRTIKEIETQVNDSHAGGAERFPGAAHGNASSAPVGASFEDLTLFMARLKQMRDWLQQDNRLLTVVDDCIRQHVRGMERRANTFSIQLTLLGTLVGALLGWLLSVAQSPEALIQAILPH
jgi:hypothetical protein